jgi:hypothetical protein
VAETLHIFLSGFRRAYRVAVLNAVCAPIGSSQTFEYTLSKNVSEATKGKLATTKQGSPVFVSFADRYTDGGYQYLPVRSGEFLSAISDSGKVQVTVCFGSWPEVRAANNFSQWVQDTLVPLGAPRLVESPENEADGQYLLFGPGLTDGFFEPNRDGWEALAGRLSEAKVLKTSAEQTVIFSRIDILEVGSNKTAPWDTVRSLRLRELLTLKGLLQPKGPSTRYPRKPMLRLKRSASYRVRVSYVFPLQRTNQQAEVPYELTVSSGLEPGGQVGGSAAALSRSQEFDFRIVPLTPRSRESLTLQFGPAPSELKGLLAPKLEVPIEPRVSGSLMFWVAAIGLLWIIGTGYASQAAELHQEFRLGFYLGPLCQYAGLLAMFRIFGFKLT